jgi:hypothetical protein
MTLEKGSFFLSPGRISSVLFIVFVFSGCASIDHIYSLNYKKLTLSHSQLIHDGLTVLPLNFHYEEELYAKTAQAIFLKNLKGIQKDIELSDPTDSAKTAKESGVYDAYLQLTQMDLKKDVPRELLIRKVGRAMGKRFLLISELSNTRLAEGATQLRLKVQIWDVEVGEIVWEASEESRGYVVLIFPQTPAPLEKVMEVASIDLIRKMP